MLNHAVILISASCILLTSPLAAPAETAFDRLEEESHLECDASLGGVATFFSKLHGVPVEIAPNVDTNTAIKANEKGKLKDILESALTPLNFEYEVTRERILIQPMEERLWEYPATGPASRATHSAGKAGTFRSYRTVTKDPPEKVIRWYWKRLQLDENHDVVQHAKAGFRKLDKPYNLSYVAVHNTDEKEAGAVILATLSADSANVHIFLRLGNAAARDTTISIVSSSGKTAVSVIRSVDSP